MNLLSSLYDYHRSCGTKTVRFSLLGDVSVPFSHCAVGKEFDIPLLTLLPVYVLAFVFVFKVGFNIF